MPRNKKVQPTTPTPAEPGTQTAGTPAGQLVEAVDVPTWLGAALMADRVELLSAAPPDADKHLVAAIRSLMLTHQQLRRDLVAATDTIADFKLRMAKAKETMHLALGCLS